MLEKISLFSLTFDQYCQEVVSRLNKGGLHAGILYSQWYRYGAFDSTHPAFSNAQSLFKKIVEITDVSMPPINQVYEEGDTYKFTVDVGGEVESVIIPMKTGLTLCVSSQVGCQRGCRFCETGRMGLLKQLSAKEIVAQFLHAKFTFKKPIRNVVFMGMGEPFDNFDVVHQAVKILSDDHGLSVGQRHITISTSGVVPGIEKMIKDMHPGINLAISLSAPNDEKRMRIMPINRHWNMATIKTALKKYCQSRKRSVMVSYVLLKGVNDAIDDADQLITFCDELDVKINLIPYNPQRQRPYLASDIETMDAFASHLKQKGLIVLYRKTKGQSIMAACGQLGKRKTQLELLSI
ncbi:MAG: 23S rRNA (adenine(2503)-C(2))-methyltransferase RlmN [Parachlamydiales bacterium]|nr:23S rRNA (adenine(2503)-C(2))-methyltransferase RlmN [Parachlamydiales bacterium]